MSHLNILAKLKETGARLTKTRQKLLEIFESHAAPLAELELRKKMAHAGVKVNKTTIYRELHNLKIQQIVREVEFGDGKKRFEINHGHHHHAVCTNCERVEDIEVGHDVEQLEKQLAKTKKFHVVNHSLEFFGLCRQCQ